MSEINQEFLLEAVRKKQEEMKAEEESQEQAEKAFTVEQFQSVAKAMGEATTALVAFLKANSLKVEVKNPQKTVATPDVSKVATAIGKLEKKLDKVKPADNTEIASAIKELAKAIEGQEPAPEAVSITNIDELAKTLLESQQQLNKTLSSLKLEPKITVPKPTVTVQPTDTQSIVAGLKKVEKAIEDNAPGGGGGGAAGSQDPLQRFTPVDMDDSTTVQYYSYIATDGEFYIRKVDKSGAYTTIRFYFGKGVAEYTTAWTGRAALTYTMWAA